LAELWEYAGADAMKTEQLIDRVFEALSDIKKNMDQQIRSLDEEIRRAHLEYIESSFQEQFRAAECAWRRP
jgi:hypothetical protein